MALINAFHSSLAAQSMCMRVCVCVCVSSNLNAVAHIVGCSTTVMFLNFF